MDFYQFFWGIFKYILPATLFVLSVVFFIPVLIIISVIWAMGSILITLLTMESDSGGRRGNTST
ncbi:hypothetical protein GCM10007108_06680 [Thermogymnomonas acidicola]|uniref:Uncharacterized protein n=1 Tax=Thermogymnomonas acidicola TaxID=399579 RepID=A0AA37BRJ3_9ARCH|nr:hypothetical protein GCM10007108_06680 [Thermogymnomonas acidicola]